MATPRFGADRIANVPPLNLLDALYAQGMRKEDLQPLIGMATPEITSYLLRNNTDRNLLDRAVRMAQGEELGALGKAGTDYDKLAEALTMRGVDTRDYGGPRDAAALASWASAHGASPQVLGNATATALPGYRLLGGVTIDDAARQGVTLFSNPQSTPATERGNVEYGGQGVRGQTAPNARDIAAAGSVAAATPPAGTNKPTPIPGTPGPSTDLNKDKISNPATWSDDQIKDFIKQNFGSNAYFIDIPEVWNALKNVVQSGKGVNGLEPALESTSWWHQTNASARSYYVQTKADPAQQAADIASQTQTVHHLAQTMGLTIDPVREQQIAQSYLRYGWTQTDLQSAIGAEWHYDPSSKQQATAVTSMKADAQNWLVPLSDQAIQSWGQGLIQGTVTQDQFDSYLRDNAKSLFPQFSNLIDAHAGDKNFNISTFADPYRQTAASTLGIQPDQIDFSDPKWRKALDVVDPKTNDRRIMTLAEWTSTLKTDPTYNYDSSQGAVTDAISLGNSLKASLGF